LNIVILKHGILKTVNKTKCIKIRPLHLGVPLDVEMWNGIFENPRAQKLTKNSTFDEVF